jgi:hypothetical protein
MAAAGCAAGGQMGRARRRQTGHLERPHQGGRAHEPLTDLLPCVEPHGKLWKVRRLGQENNHLSPNEKNVVNVHSFYSEIGSKLMVQLKDEL